MNGLFLAFELSEGLVIAIIGIIGTLTAAILAFASNQKGRKTESMRQIVSNERLKYLNDFREMYADLYNALRVETLQNNFGKDNRQHVAHLMMASSKFECHLKYFYKQEREICDLQKEILAHALAFYKNGKLADNYQNLVQKLYELCQVYDWAYWQYLQKLSIGDKYLNSDSDFDSAYNQLISKIK